MMTGIVSAIVGVIQLIVGLRFVMLLLGASPANDFVAWIYDVSTPLVAPFAGIFGRSSVIADGVVVQSVFEWTSLIAMLVYALVGGLLIRLLGGGRRPA